jgi:serine protease Do
LKLRVAETAPGTAVPVKVWRGGSEKNLEITLKQLPGSEQLAENAAGDKDDTGTLNGVAVDSLNQSQRQEFNIPETVKGAVITSVDPNSAAADAGLKSGDVIEEINRHPVKNADDAVKLAENGKDKHTLVRVWSNGGSRYIVIDESHKAG